MLQFETISNKDYDWPDEFCQKESLHNDDHWKKHFSEKITFADGTSYYYIKLQEYLPVINGVHYYNHNAFENVPLIEENLRTLSDYLIKYHPDYVFAYPKRTNKENVMVKILENGPEEYYNVFYPVIPDSFPIDYKKVAFFKLNKEEVFEAAAAFGKFAAVTSLLDVNDFKIPKAGLFDPIASYERLKYLLKTQKNNDILKKLKKEINLIEQNKSIIRRYQTFTKHPETKIRIVHNNAKVLNTIFDRDGKGMYLLGLNYAMPGYFLNDVGSLIRDAACYRDEKWKQQISTEFISAITEGYLNTMKDHLSPFEIEHMQFAGEVVMYTKTIDIVSDYLDKNKVGFDFSLIVEEFTYFELFLKTIQNK